MPSTRTYDVLTVKLKLNPTANNVNALSDYGVVQCGVDYAATVAFEERYLAKSDSKTALLLRTLRFTCTIDRESHRRGFRVVYGP